LTRFITPFGFHSTASEVIAGVDLTGKTAIVTGGAAGVGLETSRALAAAGAAVTLAVRRPHAAESIAANLRASTGNQSINVRHLDLSDLRSVQTFADEWEGPQKYTGGVKTPPDRQKNPEQGASTSVLLAASPLLDGISGLYFEDCQQAQPVTRRPTDFTGGYAAYAVAPAIAERLWSVALKLIGERS
jgi:short chain dehydrogenase